MDYGLSVTYWDKLKRKLLKTNTDESKLEYKKIPNFSSNPWELTIKPLELTKNQYYKI